MVESNGIHATCHSVTLFFLLWLLLREAWVWCCYACFSRRVTRYTTAAGCQPGSSRQRRVRSSSDQQQPWLLSAAALLLYVAAPGQLLLPLLLLSVANWG